MKEIISVTDTKLKSIIVNGELHSKFKNLCKIKNLKIGGVIEDLIKLYLHDPDKMQELINGLKNEYSEVINEK